MKQRRVRDLMPPKRQHPVCEQIIRNNGWTPYIVCDAAGAYWAPHWVRDPARPNNEPMHVANDMNEQLVTMMLAGEFGKEVKDVVVDVNRWQKIYDDLVDIPIPHRITEQSLRILDLRRLAQRNDRASGETQWLSPGPTTGPVPTTWRGVVERDSDQPSFTYAFRFGTRDLWKIGHASDIVARLAEVNKHVPYEVLGERWDIVLQQRWSTGTGAYAMEQRVLNLLRTESSVGERVACTREILERTWSAAVVGIRLGADGPA